MPSLKPELTMQISIGNIIAFVGMLLAFVTAWNKIDSSVSVNADAVGRVETQLSIGNKSRGIISTRIRVVEVKAIRQEERTNNVLNSLTRIERQLQRIDNHFGRED